MYLCFFSIIGVLPATAPMKTSGAREDNAPAGKAADWRTAASRHRLPEQIEAETRHSFFTGKKGTHRSDEFVVYTQDHCHGTAAYAGHKHRAPHTQPFQKYFQPVFFHKPPCFQRFQFGKGTASASQARAMPFSVSALSGKDFPESRRTENPRIADSIANLFMQCQ